MPKSKHVDAEIGKLIVAARKRRKMTREAAAELIGISYPMLQRHERGLSPVSVSRLLQLAEVLGVPPASLLPVPLKKIKARQLPEDPDEAILVTAYREIPGGTMRSKALELFVEMAKAGKGRKG